MNNISVTDLLKFNPNILNAPKIPLKIINSLKYEEIINDNFVLEEDDEEEIELNQTINFSLFNNFSNNITCIIEKNYN